MQKVLVRIERFNSISCYIARVVQVDADSKEHLGSNLLRGVHTRDIGIAKQVAIIALDGYLNYFDKKDVEEKVDIEWDLKVD